MGKSAFEVGLERGSGGIAKCFVKEVQKGGRCGCTFTLEAATVADVQSEWLFVCTGPQKPVGRIKRRPLWTGAVRLVTQ